MNGPVGLIGLGLLGAALAKRLLAAGFQVVGFDTDAACRERFASTGGTVTDEIAGVAARCRRVLLSLPDSTISGRVARELVLHLSVGAFVIDTTTGDPAEMTAVGDELAAAGVGYLDATVAGSSTQAADGEALVLVGGDAQHVADCRDVLDAISSKVIPVGPRGSGARMKLVVNLVLGLNRAVLAEGLTFARLLGVDPVTALDVLRQSPAASTVMRTKGEKMVTADFTPQARLRQHLKDVRLILEQSDVAMLPLSMLHAELLQSLVDRGFGDEDNAAVIRAFG